VGVLIPLVARAGVLAEAGSVLTAARGGRGALLTITGEPRIGKTRLAEEAAERAGEFEVVWTWGAAAGGAALGPWSRVLRGLAGRHAAVARLIADSPFLAGLTDPARAGGGRDPGGARSQLSFDLAEVIAAAAAARPVLVVFDDAHQADTSSLRLLAELAPALRTMSAAVLVTARDGDQDWHGRLDMRTALLRSGDVISLQPLAEGDVAAVVAGVTGAPAGPDLVGVITERSAGNPFLVTELARQLAGTDAGLAAGRDTSLLQLAEPGEDRFRHDLVRDAIYDSIPADAREDLHTRADGVLASLAGRGRDVDDAEVAYHLARAGTAAAGPAAEYARRAGDRALAALAFEDAVHWYERAASSLAALRAGDDEQARAALRLGTARLAAGDLDGGRAGFRQAAERARRARRPDLLARAALGLGGGPAGFEVALLDGEQISLLEEARSVLPDGQGTLIALVTARLSIASTLLLPEARRLELATEAVRQARSAGDDATLAATLAALCDAIAGPDHCAARRAHATEIIDLAARLRDPVLGLLGRRLRLVALLETGAIADWEADALAYRAAAEALRHPLYLWYVPLWRGMRALAAGRPDECRAALAEAAAIGERAASGNAIMLVQTQWWCLRAEERDIPALLPMLDQLETVSVPAPWLQVTRALVLAQAGRTEDARAQLEAMVPLLPAMARDSEWLPSMAQVAETIALIGPHPVARWAYDALSPYAGLIVVEGICAAIRGPVDHHLALLADALGEQEAAARHRSAAVAGARPVGALALAARIEGDQRGAS
jgi:AAA ATPase domain